MQNMEITSLSSRGQIVIPQNIREQMHLKDKEKFIVIGEKDTILLKKIEMPSFKEFNNLLNKTREFAKTNNLTKKDLEKATKRARKK